MTNFLPEHTIQYKTYLKNTMVEALEAVFHNHPDSLLQGTKVTIEYPRTEQNFPAVIIRFFEKDIMNAGVGHVELLTIPAEKPGQQDRVFKFKHYFYTGDIEFVVYALSSYDRDLMADTIVQTIAMGKLEGYTNRFFQRVYPENANHAPASDLHFIGLNNDHIQGFGESQLAADWGAEDEVIYMTSYRVAVFGEFYSLPPNIPYEFIRQVIDLPYLEGVEPVPEGNPNDGADWEP